MTDYVPMDREEVGELDKTHVYLAAWLFELEARIDALECWRDKDETPSKR